MNTVTQVKPPTQAQLAATFSRLSAGVADDVTWKRVFRLHSLLGELVSYNRDAKHDTATVVFASSNPGLFLHFHLGTFTARLTVFEPWPNRPQRTVEISRALFGLVEELAEVSK